MFYFAKKWAQIVWPSNSRCTTKLFKVKDRQRTRSPRDVTYQQCKRYNSAAHCPTVLKHDRLAYYYLWAA